MAFYRKKPRPSTSVALKRNKEIVAQAQQIIDAYVPPPPQPVRIQRNRAHKQVSPNGLPILYVGRPSKWGNPYKVKLRAKGYVVLDGHSQEIGELVFSNRSAANREAVRRYRIYIEDCINRKVLDVAGLKGNNLSCWCGLHDSCHADVLLEIASR
jgi:hypothetical protein